MARFEQKDRSSVQFERQAAPCEIFRLVQPWASRPIPSTPLPSTAAGSSSDGRARAKSSRRSTTWCAPSIPKPSSSPIARAPSGLRGSWVAHRARSSEATREVIVESAIFDPVNIRRTGSGTGCAPRPASDSRRARSSGSPASGPTASPNCWPTGPAARWLPDASIQHPREPDPSKVAFRPARINRLLGADIAADEQAALLERVGIVTEPALPDTEIVISGPPMPETIPVSGDEAVNSRIAVVPTWRRDIAIEADVAEEVARIRGYEATPGTLPDTPMPRYRRVAPRVARRNTGRPCRRRPDRGRDPRPRRARHGRAPQLARVRQRRHRRRRRGVGRHRTDPCRQSAVEPAFRPASRCRREPARRPLEQPPPGSRRTSRSTRSGRATGCATASRRSGGGWRWSRRGAAEPRAWNRPLRPYDIDDLKGVVELVAHELGCGPAGIRPLPRGLPACTRGGRPVSLRRDGTPDAARSSLRASSASCIPRFSSAGRSARSGSSQPSSRSRASPAGSSAPSRRRPCRGSRSWSATSRSSSPGDRPSSEIQELIRDAAGHSSRDVRLFDVYPMPDGRAQPRVPAQPATDRADAHRRRDRRGDGGHRRRAGAQRGPTPGLRVRRG